VTVVVAWEMVGFMGMKGVMRQELRVQTYRAA